MLDVIQAQLEAIYGLRCEYRASDFLVGAETARTLGGTGRSREELLVCHDGGDLELALYIEPALLERLSAFSNSPAQVLESELPGYCEAVEGVSHFIYVANTAAQGRRVSLLELEAQAEIDKFAACVLLRWGRDVGGWASTLVGKLFQRVRFNDALSVMERWRYTEANRLAGTYAARVLKLVRRGHLDNVLRELRHAYRLGAEAKLQYLARAT